MTLSLVALGVAVLSLLFSWAAYIKADDRQHQGPQQ